MWKNITTEQIIAVLNDPRYTLLIIALSVWILVWKGLALWKASQKGQKVWFVVLLAVNTFGIVEILYIFWLNKCCGGKNDKQLPPAN